MKRLIPAIAIVLLIAVVCYGATRNADDDTSPETSTAVNTVKEGQKSSPTVSVKRASVSIATNTSIKGEAVVLKPGRSLRFQVLSEQTVKMSDGGEGPGDIAVTIEGIWEVLVVDKDEYETHLKNRFESVRLAVTVEGENVLDPQAAKSILRTLKRSTYVTLDHTGRVVATHHEAGGDEKAMEILNGLVSSIQVVGSEARQGAWIAEESDPTGDYIARYKREGNRIEKTKTRYVRVNDTLGTDIEGIEPPTVLHSVGTIQLSKGWIQSLNIHERIRPNLQNFGLDIQIESKTRLQRISSAFDASRIEADLTWMDDRITGLLHVPEDPQKTQAAVDAQLLKSHSNTDIVRDLHRFTGEKMNHAEAFRTMQRISAAVRRDPSSANLFLDSALESGNPRTLSTTLGGLAEAGTPAAQEAMASLLSNVDASTPDREAAAANLGIAKSPTPETAAALSAQLDDADPDVVSTSELAMGNAAKSLKETDKETAGDIVEELVERYFTAADLLEKRNTLLALGNTGDSRILPCVDDALGSDVLNMRTAAASALRFVVDPTRNPTLAILMTHDVDLAVRVAAIQASQYQSLVPLTEALTTVIQADPESNVRLAAIIVVGQALEQSPVFTELLNWSAENDPHPDVLARAQSLLGDATNI